MQPQEEDSTAVAEEETQVLNEDAEDEKVHLVTESSSEK